MEKFYLFDLDGTLLKKGGCDKSFSLLKKGGKRRLLLKILMDVYELVECCLVFLGLLGPVEVNTEIRKILKIVALRNLKDKYKIKCGIFTNRSRLGLENLEKRGGFPDLEIFEVIFIRKSIFSKFIKLRNEVAEKIIELEEIKPHKAIVEKVEEKIGEELINKRAIEVVEDCLLMRNLFLSKGIKAYHPDRFVPKF